MTNRLMVLCTVALALSCPLSGMAQEAKDLRLVPFPKQVSLEQGQFSLNRQLILEAPVDQCDLLASTLGDEFQRVHLPAPEVRGFEGGAPFFRLSTSPTGAPPTIQFRNEATNEDYALFVRPNEIVCLAPGRAGVFCGIQTLRQLIRANRRDGGLPCLEVRDWPSLRWRCFQDDMTRGPSSTLDTLKFEAALGAHFKMNLFTYYMEYQYRFKKHPLIGPEDGSLEPADLRVLVEYAKRRHVDVLGNQQSFGHFSRILRHEEYADLGETPSLLCPVKEGSYELLDDIYSEVCPLLPFEFFNVCCDETWGLGTGPSKELADEIGVGGVYVGHIRRVYDLLKNKYQKRMMMWGDIILQHPERLEKIPKDTIMLTWGYGARPNFENQITPFADSGYEFFVCPGISNWSRILPDFGTATTNIRNFVRDGAKLGALGMLNTAWEDDGDALQGYKWHGYAWGAECAWNASTTTPKEFNRRIGAVLFGEKGDHFGRAIELLSQTHRMAGMQGMLNRRFWQDDFLPTRSPGTIQKSADRLLAVVRPAIEHLEACREEATVNRALLDVFLFGARRMELIGQRMLDGLEAARLYTQACESPSREALPSLAKVEALVATNRGAYETLGREFKTLWLSESKPYAVDWTLDRYTAAVKKYDDLARRLVEARKKAEAGQPLPHAEDLGLLVPEAFARRGRPYETVETPLAPDAPWAERSATHRVGVTVRAGNTDRFELPVAVEMGLPNELASKPLRAFCRLPGKEPREILAQLDPSKKPNRSRLTMLIPDSLAKGTEAVVHVYLGLPEAPEPLPEAVKTEDAPNGMKWIENDKVRLLLAPEGGHVYRWEVKGLDDRDLTVPGQTGWSGFADVHSDRQTPHTLKCVARGPALVRYECGTEEGMVKSVGLFGGVSWMEVVFNEPVGHYWEFDNPKNFAADGPSPGTYLFSNGDTGPVSKDGSFTETQIRVANVHWGIKHNVDRLALGLATPEVAANFVIGPGSGSGGAGIENSPLASHFVTYGGLLKVDPAETMARLRTTLDFKNQPRVILHAIQTRNTPREILGVGSLNGSKEGASSVIMTDLIPVNRVTNNECGMRVDPLRCEIRTPTGDRRLPWHRLLTEIFPSDRPLLDGLVDQPDRFPDWPSHALYSGNEILGNVSLAPMQVWIEGGSTELTGIAWVATRAKYRRNGVATCLLRHALEVVDRRGLPSVLFTGLPGVYEPLGYTAVPQIYLAAAAREVARFRPRFETSVHETLPPSFVEEMVRVYAEEYPNLDGKIDRDAKYWQLYQTMFNGNPNVKIILCRKKDLAVGYARIKLEDDRMLLSELCCQATAADAAETLLNVAAELATCAKCDTITLALPSTHLAMRILGGSDVSLHPEPAGAAREAFMVRAVKNQALGSLRKLQWPLSDKF